MPAGDRKLAALDPVSRVTLHLFLAQLAIALAITAALPAPFPASFAAALAVIALMQAGAATHSAPGTGTGSLTEWDAVAWLLATASLALAAA